MTRAYIAEYGGLGSNTDNVYAFGTSCMYDRQGNLFVLGAASYGNNSGGMPSGSGNEDSLMLKYSPDGSLLFHKTWWDSANQNCGATNVACDIVIDNNTGTEWIVWLANNWGNSGCFYGIMDTNGNIGGSGNDNANAGINQTWPTDITSNVYGQALISTSWNYTNANAPNDTAYIPAIISIPEIFTSGTLGFSTGIAGLNTDSTLAPGVFEAVVIDNGGYGYAIGSITIDGVQHALLVGLNPSGSVIWQYIIDTNTTSSSTYGCYGESIALSPDGYFYTVVNDRSNNVIYLDKWESGPTSISNTWRSTVSASGGPPNICGYDINFDSTGNPIVSGIAPVSFSNGDATGYPAIAKFDKTTGNLLFVNLVLVGGGGGGGEEVWTGEGGDPFVGHRCGAVYQDRFAFSCMSVDDLTDNQTHNPRVLNLQVPADGSLAPTYQGGIPGTYTNLTYFYSATVTQFTPAPTTFTVIDLSSQTNPSSSAMMATTNATDINSYSSSTITLGNFGSMGLTIRPGGTIRPGTRLQAPADPNPATNVGGIDISIVDGATTGPVYVAAGVHSNTGFSNSQWSILSSPLGSVPDGFTYIETTFNTADTARATVSNGGATITALTNSGPSTAITGFPIPVGAKALIAMSLDVYNGQTDNDAIGITTASGSDVQDDYLGNKATGIGIFDDGSVYTYNYQMANNPVRYFPNGKFESNGYIVELAVDMVNFKMWYRVNGGSWNPRSQTSITFTSADILGNANPIYQNTTSIGTNGVDGFQNTASDNLAEGYQAYNLSSTFVNTMSAYLTGLGISPTNSTGYVYNVTWGTGSTISSGLVKIGFYNGNGDHTQAAIDFQPIDPTDTTWQNNNNNSGTSLVGTFLFPATFSIHAPLTDKNGWC
jgi:hypothetical protein